MTSGTPEEIAAIALLVRDENALDTQIPLSATEEGQEWTADVVAQMHMAKITMKRLAAECGYTPEYVSMVLNGHRDTETAKATILSALDRLVAATSA